MTTHIGLRSNPTQWCCWLCDQHLDVAAAAAAFAARDAAGPAAPAAAVEVAAAAAAAVGAADAAGALRAELYHLLGKPHDPVLAGGAAARVLGGVGYWTAAPGFAGGGWWAAIHLCCCLRGSALQHTLQSHPELVDAGGCCALVVGGHQAGELWRGDLGMGWGREVSLKRSRLRSAHAL